MAESFWSSPEWMFVVGLLLGFGAGAGAGFVIGTTMTEHYAAQVRRLSQQLSRARGDKLGTYVSARARR